MNINLHFNTVSHEQRPQRRDADLLANLQISRGPYFTKGLLLCGGSGGHSTPPTCFIECRVRTVRAPGIEQIGTETEENSAMPSQKRRVVPIMTIVGVVTCW
jgi:hypothetical protein